MSEVTFSCAHDSAAIKAKGQAKRDAADKAQHHQTLEEREAEQAAWKKKYGYE